MYEDDPQDLVFDLEGRAIFGDHPLGRRGDRHRRGGVGDRPRPTCRLPRRALPARLDRDRGRGHGRARRARRARPRRRAAAGQRRRSAPGARRRRHSSRGSSSWRKETEQYHVCVGGSGARARRRAPLRAARARRDPRRNLLIAPVPGDPRAARPRLLGLQLSEPLRRQRRGRPLRRHAARQPRFARWRSSPRELRRCVEDPASEEELVRAHDNVKGRIVLALESTSARMGRLGGALLSDMPMLSTDEVIERIDAVRIEDLRELAAELFAPERMSIAGVGPDESVFRARLRGAAGGCVIRVGSVRRGRAHGGDGLPRGRRRRGHGAERPCRPGTRHRARRRSRRVPTSSSTSRSPTRRSRTRSRALRRGRPRRDRHDRLRPRAARGGRPRGGTQRAARAELRDRRRADDALRRARPRRTWRRPRSSSCTTTRRSTRPAAPRNALPS